MGRGDVGDWRGGERESFSIAYWSQGSKTLHGQRMKHGVLGWIPPLAFSTRLAFSITIHTGNPVMVRS